MKISFVGKIASGMIILALLAACAPQSYTRTFTGVKATYDVDGSIKMPMPDILWAQGKSASELFALWRHISERGLANLPLSEQQNAFNIEEAIGFKLRDSGSNDPVYASIQDYALSKNSTDAGSLLPHIATCRAVDTYKAAQRKWGIHSSEYTNDGLIDMGVYHSSLYVMFDPQTGQPIPPPKESLCGCLEYPSGGCPK